MKRLLLAFAIISLLTTAACTRPNITLSVASDKERLPYPKFRADDLSAEGVWPEFSEIKVYQVNNCRVPKCPIVWQVVVSEDRSPREIIYGALPSFGAQTIIASEPLKPGQSYRMELGTASGTRQTGSGAINFSVNRNGFVETVPAEEETQ